MRSLILALIVASCGSVSMAGDHCCRQPVRSACHRVAHAAKKVVSAPVRAVRHRAACRGCRS